MHYSFLEKINGFRLYEGEEYDDETCTGSFIVTDNEQNKLTTFNTYTEAIHFIRGKHEEN